MASSPITSWQIDGGEEIVTEFIFFGSKITADSDCSHEIIRCFFPCKKCYDEPRQCIKIQRHYFANKGLYSQSYGFSNSHVWMSFGPLRRLSAKELMFLNCSAGEDS